MRRNRIALVIGIIIAVVAIIVLFKFNKDVIPLWNSNNIYVTVEEPLKVEKVKIEFSNYMPQDNAFSALHAVIKEDTNYTESYIPTHTVLFDGRRVNAMGNAYGGNDFLITYDNQYKYSFSHFKYNWKPQHDYKFHFYTEDEDLYMQVSINGKYARRTEVKMSKL